LNFLWVVIFPYDHLQVYFLRQPIEFYIYNRKKKKRIIHVPFKIAAYPIERLSHKTFSDLLTIIRQRIYVKKPNLRPHVPPRHTYIYLDPRTKTRRRKIPCRQIWNQLPPTFQKRWRIKFPAEHSSELLARVTKLAPVSNKSIYI
jgi:hypothetical protein